MSAVPCRTSRKVSGATSLQYRKAAWMARRVALAAMSGVEL